MKYEWEKCIQNFSLKTSREKSLGRPRCNWKIILKSILKEQYTSVWAGFICSVYGPVAGFCKYDNELFRKKAGNFWSSRETISFS
jgi:hypothetical protein